MAPSDRLLVATVALALCAGRDALAVNCAPATRQSTCFDAEAISTPMAPSDFFTMSRARPLPKGQWALGVDFTYLNRPVSLHTASPDPDGRDLHVLDHVLDAAIAAAVAPVRHLELAVAVPFALFRSGSSLSGVTSQTGPGPSSPAFGDLRLGAGYSLFQRDSARGAGIAVLARGELTLPTGAAFAGERSPVLAPAVDVEFRQGIFFASAEEGVRIREPVEFGGEWLGTQFVSALGVGADPLQNGLLGVALEAVVAPYLLSRPRTVADGTRIDPGLAVPAEWLISIRTRHAGFTVAAAFGTGIPLSSESRRTPDGGSSSSTYSAVTTPRYRGGLTLRYTWPAD